MGAEIGRKGGNPDHRLGRQIGPPGTSAYWKRLPNIMGNQTIPADHPFGGNSVIRILRIRGIQGNRAIPGKSRENGKSRAACMWARMGATASADCARIAQNRGQPGVSPSRPLFGCESRLMAPRILGRCGWMGDGRGIARRWKSFMRNRPAPMANPYRPLIAT